MLKGESHKAWLERVRRSQEAGKQIHRQHLNNSETNSRNVQADKDAEQLKSLTESVGEERAKEIITSNRKVAKDREERLSKRRERQKNNAKNNAG